MSYHSEVAGLEQEEGDENIKHRKQTEEFVLRTIKALRLGLGKIWKRQSVNITEYDPNYKVAYLGNVITGWAKGEGCADKPVGTLWRNYCSSSRADVAMTITVSAGGLRALTREHGLTEYWSHRITYCAAPPAFPRIFCWVYRHEGRRLKQELRCHAVLCSKASTARDMATKLQSRLDEALQEFRRDKLGKQQARLSLANSIYAQPSLPRRRILLSPGSSNYRPPLERSKSAPKLGAIDEISEEESLCFDDEEEIKMEGGGSLSSESGVVVQEEEAKTEQVPPPVADDISGDESGYDDDVQIPSSVDVEFDDIDDFHTDQTDDLLDSVLKCIPSSNLLTVPGVTEDYSYVEV